MTNACDRAQIGVLHASGNSLSQLARQFGIGKAVIFGVVKAARASGAPGLPPVNADKSSQHPTPAKAHKRAMKAIGKPQALNKGNGPLLSLGRCDGWAVLVLDRPT